MRRILRCALALVVLSACGGSAPEHGERPLTSSEAARLAEVQYRNYSTLGADFSVSAAFLGFGETLSMAGSVDWRNHTGRATVSAQGKDAGVVEVIWTKELVLEARPAVSRILESTGRPGVKYVVRRPDIERRLLDRAVAMVMALASAERENAVLIRQKEGSVFMRNDELRGRKVEVLRYGRITRYWLDVETQDLLRFEGDSSSGTAPVVVDLMAFGRRETPIPPQSMVVDVSTIREIYDAATAS